MQTVKLALDEDSAIFSTNEETPSNPLLLQFEQEWSSRSHLSSHSLSSSPKPLQHQTRTGRLNVSPLRSVPAVSFVKNVIALTRLWRGEHALVLRSNAIHQYLSISVSRGFPTQETPKNLRKLWNHETWRLMSPFTETPQNDRRWKPGKPMKPQVTVLAQES